MRIELSLDADGLVAEVSGETRRISKGASIRELFTSADPWALAEEWFASGTPVELGSDRVVEPPIDFQEVWAAGVTYLRSRSARVAESRDAGGDTFYDLVYDAERPELFFKATPHRVVGHGGTVGIRKDSTWDVPEPELTLAITSGGEIFGYTVGNDMSSRSIEGENPLYLPQAKTYSRSASLGPVLLVTDEALKPETSIRMRVLRAGSEIFAGETELSQIKRSLSSLVEWLFQDNEFPDGAFLMTGTGIVPTDEFTLQEGDEIQISIEGIGTLVNHVGS